ncbi:MAG: archease [Maribacter sp.]|nr:archease [Maribacter sp.]NNK19267.1 archease [Maribacter sp.]
MKIQYLPHTADVRMRISGSTLEELFKAGMIGMGNILKEGFCNKNNPIDNKKEIDIQAVDQTCLLIDFLSEILSLCYVEKSIYCKGEFPVLTATKIVGTIYGTHINNLDEEIKAVTYHEAQVRCNSDNQWETIVVFDI